MNRNKISLRGKRVLVTGGSGSLGKAIIKKLLKHPIKEVVSISRDETLIKKAEQEISSRKVSLEIGDICDPKRVTTIMNNIDFVYHTAAMKHVGIAERFPQEVLRINILGLNNLLENSKNVVRFVYVSSDKAIGPVNCYGASKLFAEYFVKEANRLYKGRFFSIRCPNFMGSRGSVIELWKKQIKEKNTIIITEPKMTRYYVSLPIAAKFFVKISLVKNPNINEPYYPKKGVRKYRLGDLAEAFISVFGNNKSKIKIIGAFPGEKLYEDYLLKAKLSSVDELKKVLLKL